MANWSQPATNLYSYLNNDQTVRPWYATEHLKAGSVDFLAGWNGLGIGVSRMYWNGRDFHLGTPVTTAVDDRGPGGPSEVRLRVSGRIPGISRVSFEIELAAPARTRLVLYDVRGRRVKVLADRDLPIGKTGVPWDGTDAGGSAARSGMYFAQLSGSFGSRLVRVPFIR